LPGLEIASRDRIRKIGHVDVVLERERHPVQRPEPLAALTPLVAFQRRQSRKTFSALRPTTARASG
jgi:hypothetical protein